MPKTIPANAQALEGAVKSQTFYEDGFWIRPAKLKGKVVWITGCAPGGGGGSHDTSGFGGGGGGGGEAAVRHPVHLGAVPEAQYQVLLGAVGVGKAGGSSGSGTDGGDTTFGSLLTLEGGLGGGDADGGDGGGKAAMRGTGGTVQIDDAGNGTGSSTRLGGGGGGGGTDSQPETGRSGGNSFSPSAPVTASYNAGAGGGSLGNSGFTGDSVLPGFGGGGGGGREEAGQNGGASVLTLEWIE